MKAGFVIFNGMTLLDFVGVYDPLTRLKTMNFMPDFNWEICSFTDDVTDVTGLKIQPTQVKKTLSVYDLIVIPGGFSTRYLMNQTNLIEWIRTAEKCPLKASVCTGSLLLGKAGFLKNRKATTHQTAFEMLKEYCKEVVDERIVDEGSVITARGVSSSIDLGLFLCEKIAGKEVRATIQKQMDYQ